MKKKRLLAFTLIFFLSSCSNIEPLSFKEYTSYLKEIDTSSPLEGGNYYRSKEYQNLEYESFDGKISKITSLRDIYSSTNNGRIRLNAPSTKTANLLVIPVSFSDSVDSNDEKITYIQNAYFGEASTTKFESVASYYNKSSYGHLKLQGKVAPWFHLDLTSSELKSQITTNSNASRYVVGKAVEDYILNNDDINDFDLDQDGYIDMVSIVYDFPHDDKPTSLFWAYVDHINPHEKIGFTSKDSEVVNTLKPYANSYSWLSFSFLDPSDHKVDPHVFIHETGHLFGLADYYSKGDIQPTGYMDMMDYNLGDHTSYSKMLLNWLTPKVLVDQGEITLKSFTETGDVLLIPTNKYNGSVYDEYLLLEYYTPTNLNQNDSHLSFIYQDENKEDKLGNLFQTFGVKLYHVDSRIAYFKSKSIKKPITIIGDQDEHQKLEEFRKDPATLQPYCLDFAFDNDLNYSLNNHPLYELISKNKGVKFSNNRPANDKDLFKINDKFNFAKDEKFTFYNGDTLKYSFEIINMNAKEVTIKFTLK